MKEQRAWEDLANTIIEKAYYDYILAGELILRADERDQKNYERTLIAGEKMAYDTLSFFKGQWYKSLTSLDYKVLQKNARKEILKLISQYKLNETKIALLHKWFNLNQTEILSNMSKEQMNIFTIGELLHLYEKAGVTVEINDGKITRFIHREREIKC